MKYLPLVWAAIMRKPMRATLTLLSVMLAFTLFGLTIGMNATFDAVLAAAKDNPKLADMVLVRNSRLSVQPVTAAEWTEVCRMGGLKASAKKSK